MLLSLAMIFIFGMATGWICNQLRMPRLLGMVLTGIVIGPHVLNWIDPSVLGMSAELRKIALIIILARAGLTLNIADLKKVGRPAILMCFLPACLEIGGMLLLAPKLLNVSLLEAAIMGTVVAAVSPAVIVPRMIRLMEQGYGTKKSIPQLILAGASVDDIFVIVLFTDCTGMATGDKLTIWQFVNIPASILLGVLIGYFVGVLFARYCTKVAIHDTSKVLVLLSGFFLLVAAEEAIPTSITFSALIAIMFVGIGLQKGRSDIAKKLSGYFNQLWVGAEILLFVLVGATVDLQYATEAGLRVLLLLLGVLICRACGVWLCLLRTTLNRRERLFCIMAYLPKATVQAAIGGVPLAMGLSCGNIVLTVAVLAILVTAPIGKPNTKACFKPMCFK